MSAGSDRLETRLRLIVLTDPHPAAGSLVDVVTECLEAGCPAIQLRDKRASAADLYRQAVTLVPLVRAHDALLFVNDRLDVALAAGADGVHLGPDDIPVEDVRRSVPDTFLIGYSTDDPIAGREAARAGADYLGVGAVFGTSSKPGLEDEAIGPGRVGEVVRSSGLPCVGIGGVTAENALAVLEQGAGVAVLGAVMHAERPGDVVARILRMTHLDRA
ncbi:MAG: thiamine phosphate synthase [Gemmatimonadetes bacterium]|nr:thiamine phosphate synthase [Gemmatimonadota bacterium]